MIEESAKDPWSPVPLPVGGSPSASGLPWNLIQPWISGSGNNFNTGGQRFPPSSFPGQQQPGGWQSGGRPNGDYYDSGRRGGSSTGKPFALNLMLCSAVTVANLCPVWRYGVSGPCIHAFSPSDCYAVPTGEWCVVPATPTCHIPAHTVTTGHLLTFPNCPMCSLACAASGTALKPMVVAASPAITRAAAAASATRASASPPAAASGKPLSL